MDGLSLLTSETKLPHGQDPSLGWTPNHLTPFLSISFPLTLKGLPFCKSPTPAPHVRILNLPPSKHIPESVHLSMYSFSTNYLCPPGLSPRLIQSSLSPVLLTSWNCVFQGYQWNAWVWHIAIPNFILLKLSIAFVTIDHYLILEKFHPALFFFKFLQLFPFNTFWFFFFSFSRHSGHWFPNFNSSTNHVGLTIRELYVDLTSTDSLQSQVNSLESLLWSYCLSAMLPRPCSALIPQIPLRQFIYSCGFLPILDLVTAQMLPPF